MKSRHFTLKMTGTVTPNTPNAKDSDVYMTDDELNAQFVQVINDLLNDGIFSSDAPASLEMGDFSLEIDSGKAKVIPSTDGVEMISIRVSNADLTSLKDYVEHMDIDNIGNQILINTRFCDSSEMILLSARTGVSLDYLRGKNVVVHC